MDATRMELECGDTAASDPNKEPRGEELRDNLIDEDYDDEGLIALLVEAYDDLRDKAIYWHGELIRHRDTAHQTRFEQLNALADRMEAADMSCDSMLTTKEKTNGDE